MSLDVYLYGERKTEACHGYCSQCGDDYEHQRSYDECLFSANVTHNLGRMAAEAGIYEAVWRPEEFIAPELTKILRDAEQVKGYHHEDTIAIAKQLPTAYARDLIAPLRAGLALLQAEPAKFMAMEPENKWGTYADFVLWVAKYLEALEEHPNARVHASR